MQTNKYCVRLFNVDVIRRLLHIATLRIACLQSSLGVTSWTKPSADSMLVLQKDPNMFAFSFSSSRVFNNINMQSAFKQQGTGRQMKLCTDSFLTRNTVECAGVGDMVCCLLAYLKTNNVPTL